MFGIFVADDDVPDLCFRAGRPQSILVSYRTHLYHLVMEAPGGFLKNSTARCKRSDKISGLSCSGGAQPIVEGELKGEVERYGGA